MVCGQRIIHGKFRKVDVGLCIQVKGIMMCDCGNINQFGILLMIFLFYLF